MNIACPFCDPEPGRDMIVESENVYAIFDKFPVSPGHVLIIPKSHCSSFFELNITDHTECVLTLNKVMQIIKDKFNPDGFNVGINDGEAAGQTIHHVHIHLIPRYKGDVKEPRGGVRGVIPDKRDY